MKKRDALGQFEQLVLTAVLLCGEKAYGSRFTRKLRKARCHSRRASRVCRRGARQMRILHRVRPPRYSGL